MKIATQTAILGERFGDNKAVEMICDAGFDAIDFSMFHLTEIDHPLMKNDFEKKIAALKKTAAGRGVVFNQTHAPFPSYDVMNHQYNDTIMAVLQRSIEITGLLGAAHVIIHPVALKENQKEFNLSMYQSLSKYAKEAGVKIALENMFGYDPIQQKLVENVCSKAPEFMEYMDALDSRYFACCLDLGHAGLIGDTAENMISMLGHDRLKALHVHDNDHVSDLHTLPFTQRLNWKAIMKSLKEIDYEGDLTFEADYFLTGFPDDMLPHALSFMHTTGKKLVEWFHHF